MWVCLAVLLVGNVARAQSSICAEVKIQIDQKVSLERQAFEAVLKIHNGLEGVAVENLDVNLTFVNAEGVAVAATTNPDDTNASFFLSQGLLVGVEDVNGNGTVAPSTDAEAHWLIIPAPHSGGLLPQGALYQVGATVTYRMAGENKSVDVIPETITVRPQPMLDLDYFLPGYVYADDPLTQDVTEPVVPFTLGVRISNSGAGVAAHTTIESAQPKIIDNQLGLLIGFHIDGGYVDDQPAQPTLLLDFGDIAPATSRMGRWIMSTTLSGQFFDFDAAYTHSDELGGALTSLIGNVATHRLTHDVLVDLPGRDGIRDFLAQVDAHATQDSDTYRVYESDGLDAEVAQQFGAVFTGTGLSFASTPAGIPAYARAQIGVVDQATVISAARGDGKPVPPGNAWFSKIRNAAGNDWIYYINLFEADSASCGGTCTYDLTYDGAPTSASLAGVVYEDMNGNGMQDAGENGIEGIEVDLGGTSRSFVDTASDGSFQFTDLEAGTYSLMVGAMSGHYDGQHTIGSAGGTASGARIDGIVLHSGTVASGYAFAKVPQPAQLHADLGVTSFTSSSANPRAGESFTLTLAVANAGPDAAAAQAGVPLPSALQLVSASATAGTFNPTTFAWSIGPLAAGGSVQLTLQVKATVEGDQTISASIAAVDAGILDPVPGNNSGAVTVHVASATDVRISPSFLQQSRVLALAACSSRLIGSINCRETRGTKLRTFLGGKGVENLVATNARTFRDELRNGHWNVYWLDGFADLDAGTIAELGLALLRGDSLIFNGDHANGAAPIDTWSGTTYTGVHGTNAAEVVTFVSNPYLSFGNVSVTGPKYTYTNATGTLVAKFADNAPAIVYNAYGSGHVLLFAYDALTLMADNAAYSPLFDAAIALLEPPLPATRTAKSFAPIAAHLENAGAAVALDEALNVPTGALILATSPQADSQAATRAHWLRSLQPNATFDAVATMRAPPSGSAPILLDVAAQAGGSLAHEELPMTIAGTDAETTLLANEIGALPVSGTTDTNLRSSAAASLATAQTQRLKGAANAAITSLLAADAALAQIVSTDTRPVRKDLGWLVQAFDYEWYVGLPACGTTTPVVDSSGSFVPFAANQGLYLHQVNPGGYEYRVGFDTTSSTDSVGATASMVDGTTYVWALTYDGAGNLLLTVNLGTTILVHETYTAANSAKAVAAGNAVQLSVESLAGTGKASIDVGISSVDGTSVSDKIGASTGTGDATVSASLGYYSEALANGFALSGTIKTARPAQIGGQVSAARLSFRVNAGSASCAVAGR